MLSLAQLQEAVQRAAAIRRVRRMQPVGGPGDKIFPPTYPGETNNSPARHVFERRRINGESTWCVLVDSVQSQANRLEEALKEMREVRAAQFPLIAVDFSESFPDIGLITILDAPHRVFDAIFRDSELNGVKFSKTSLHDAIVTAKSHHAEALFRVAPTALVFGAWNSTGEGGGLGAKFPRTVVSEIVGIGVATEARQSGQSRASGAPHFIEEPSGKRTGSRIDPLGIRAGIKVYRTADGWEFEKPAGSKAEELKPSEINHSNIRPTVDDLGVSVDYLVHTYVLSCSALRRLRFGDAAPSVAARTTLAALGLGAAVFQDEVGYFLRSRCDLVPEANGSSDFEIVHADGAVTPFSISTDEAAKLICEGAEAAAVAGLRWDASDVVLRPQKKLLELVQQSRAMALKGELDAAQQ